jgi:hypothetical protein
VAAGLWLLAGGFFDVLDGTLARHLKVKARIPPWTGWGKPWSSGGSWSITGGSAMRGTFC